ncbi:MAG: T9SS type A sorting domain-containing protein, partial [Candidatus Krumholzibacteriota bacterium]|nr:T9SS type A sorting domain-containing protein [Candidatus Krumholzibacteriota bacterium]
LGTGADGVMVVSPATIAEAVSNALSPDAVSKQSSVAFLVDFVNSGGATIGLDTSLTTISFDDGSTTYIAQLDPNGPTAITPPGVTLRFQPSGVDNALLVGSYHPMIHLEGSENGLPFQQDVILADSVEVENAPALSLSAWVVDNIVSVGETFVVSAVVTNVAGGADVVPPAELTLDLSGATGYSLPAANPVQTFIVGDTIRWDVRAPSQPSRPDQLSVSISAIPLDENSAQPAALAVGSVQIAVVTEGATIAVRDVSDFLGLDTAVVPGGARDVRKLGFEMTYTVTDPLVADARIDTVAITVLGESGAPLPASAVQGTLRRLFVELGGTQVYEVTAPFTNPVVVAIPGAASERMIPPDGTVTAIVGVDVHNSPPVQEIRLQVRGSGLRITDSGTGQNIAVIDDGTGQPLTGQLVSQPLVILSNRFEEYAHNYPNPFRAGSQSTRIAYFLDSSTSVSIKVYTITGELVYEESIPVGDPRTATGARETPWDGRNTKGEVIRNGVYVCVITAGSKSTKFRIAVAK